MERCVVKVLVTAIAIGLSACAYDVSYGDCAVRCTTASGCPDGLSCGPEGLCRVAGAEACALDGDAAPACMNFGDPIVDLALNQPAQADEEIDSPGARAKNANDGNGATRWSTDEGAPGHWWMVDLGSGRLVESINTLWEMDGVNFKFDVSISSDGTNFTTAIDQTADTRTTRSRTDAFPGGTCTRFVRITKTDTTGYWAILYTVNVMGK